MRFAFLLLGIWLIGHAQGLDLSDPARAEPELAELAAEWEDAWSESPSPENAAGLAASLQALGVIQRQRAKPEAAVANLRRANELLADQAGEQRTDTREALALALQDLGRFDESEVLLREVVGARRAAPASSLALALALDHLALGLLLQGRYTEVAPLLEEALDLLPEENGTERARVTGHLGRFYHTLGSHGRAIQLFDEALAIPLGDSELALSLRSQRALATLRLGRVEQAILDTEAVADDARDLLEGRPIRAVPYINNLGALSLSLGRPEEAAQAFREARDLLLDSVGPEHPALASVHHNLGAALQQSGSLDLAREEFLAANRLHGLHLAGDHLRVAETQRELAINAILSGSDEAAPLAREATAGGLRLLERLVADGSETQRLNFIERFDLTSLPCALEDPELIADTLLASKARLLDLRMGGTQAEPPGWRQISESLPKQAAYIDFCRYRPLTGGEPDRYGAVILMPGRSPEWVSLGDAEELERWLGALKARLDWNAARLGGEDPPAPPLKLAGILGFLHQRFWRPIEERIPREVRHLAVSLDGATHMLPLCALIDGEGQLLSGRYDQVARVISGRDLLESPALPEIGAAPWSVLTIPEYPGPAPVAGARTALGTIVAGLGPLPGTTREAKVLKDLAPQGSQFLSGAEVTEMQLADREARPVVVHFGGHAFFAGSPRSGTPLDFDLESDQLFASGLVLHQGISRLTGIPQESPLDDLLFPAEIARLDLVDTRLVTLSSCDSGLGTSVQGEGILGLQRAFAMAGAREVVCALWPVSDRSTPEFMKRFYELASHSNRPAQSLWQTQAELLPNPEDPAFEEAVLRFAPFMLTQSHSLKTAPTIEYQPTRRFPWLPVAALLGLGGFWLARRGNRARSKTVEPPEN